MFLREFKSTDIQRTPASVFNAAKNEPIIINRMGHDSVIMMSKDQYSELVKKASQGDNNAPSPAK